MSGNGPPTYSRSNGWGRGVQSNVQMSGPKYGCAAAVKTSRTSPRSNSRSIQHNIGGKLTFSKQNDQGNRVVFSQHNSTPLQDQSFQQQKGHVEARNFGVGLTQQGPGNISQERQELLGQLNALVQQAEIVVNRLARDIRTAEEQNSVGKLRPRLLRAAASAEKIVMNVNEQVNGQINMLQLGQSNQIDPRTGEKESDIVQLFTVRLETAARKIYTLGFETPGTEMSRRKYIVESLANKSVYSPPSARNIRHLGDQNGNAIGDYGKFQRPNILRASTYFKD